MKASALALRDVPELNASWMDSFIRQYDNVDINVAVQTESGLLTPLVPNVDKLGLQGISSNIKELAGKARDNKLSPADLTVRPAPSGLCWCCYACSVLCLTRATRGADGQLHHLQPRHVWNQGRQKLASCCLARPLDHMGRCCSTSAPSSTLRKQQSWLSAPRRSAWSLLTRAMAATSRWCR